MLKQTLTTLSILTASAAFAGTPAPQPVVEPVVQPSLISYSNFSLEYSYLSADLGVAGVDVDGHGVQAALEYSPVEHLYFALRGGWHDVDVDFFGLVNLDFDYWNVNGGVGGYFPITENIHLAAEVGASYADISLTTIPGVQADDWGVYVTPHVRAKFGMFETHVGVTYNSNDLAASEWTGFARVLFEVAPQVDLYVGGTIGFSDNTFEDLYGFQGGVRVKF